MSHLAVGGQTDPTPVDPPPPRVCDTPQTAQRVIPRDISMGIMAMEQARKTHNIKVRVVV